MIQVVAEGLSFPESPYWSSIDGCLYLVEWTGDQVLAWRDNRVEQVFKTEQGEGPCGLCQDKLGNFWICMYSHQKVELLSPKGETLYVIDSFNGKPLNGPNDVTVAPNGGIFFYG